MTAILILIVAALCAWGYGRWLGKVDGEMTQALGLLVLIPWAAILIGTIAALLVLT